VVIVETAAALQSRISTRKFTLRVLASGLTMMALDLLLNAGVFARLWLVPSPFLLSPQDLFRRLPLGYLAFFLQAVVYVWLTMLVGARSWRQGGLTGLKVGVVLNLACVLGLRSATTASWSLLIVAWLVGGTVLTTGACFMAGWASEKGERRALVSALILLVGAVIVVAVFQSIGLIPMKRMN
jgi:hypothetical protein